jgi:Electron transfer DM13
MKHQILVLTTVASILVVAITTVSIGNSRSINAQPAPSKSIITTQKVVQQQKPVSGKFVKVDHPTQGTASIVTKSGKQYLQLDRSFKTDNAPDLQVLLHQQGSPKDYSGDNYVNLGRLQKITGAQLYEIPTDVDIKRFKSAVIWCRIFNSTFGFAPLK